MLTIMEPLDKVVDASGKLVHESFLDQTVILSGMWTKSAEPPPGVTGADHWVAAAFHVRQEAQEGHRRGH